MDDVFKKFTPYQGEVEEGYAVDFIGVKTRKHYYVSEQSDKYWQRFAPCYYGYPKMDFEYHEWLSLLRSIKESSGLYTMIEAGAGWGRWSVRAARACILLGKNYSIIAIEPEYTHYEWLLQHAQDNNVRVEVINKAITRTNGYSLISNGNPQSDYGQSVHSMIRGIRKSRIVPTINFNDILDRFYSIDFIDMDIQGLETEVIKSSINKLAEKCKRIYVELHREQDVLSVPKILNGSGFTPEFIIKENDVIDNIPMPENCGSWINVI